MGNVRNDAYGLPWDSDEARCLNTYRFFAGWQQSCQSRSDRLAGSILAVSYSVSVWFLHTIWRYSCAFWLHALAYLSFRVSRCKLSECWFGDQFEISSGLWLLHCTQLSFQQKVGNPPTYSGLAVSCPLGVRHWVHPELLRDILVISSNLLQLNWTEPLQKPQKPCQNFHETIFIESVITHCTTGLLSEW